MKLEILLQSFYKQNGIPLNGGIDEDFFDFKVFGITFKLPNPQFRKDLIHIHDIQHILNKQDISWKGEAYIAGWEISTGMWKHLPAAFLSLWAMGYALWIHPKAVFQGYKKGLDHNGIIDLKYNKQEFLQMEFEHLKTLVYKNTHTNMGLLQWIQFVIWCVLSEIIMLFPLLIMLSLLFLFICS